MEGLVKDVYPLQMPESKSEQLKLVDQFTYFGSNISSTECDTNIRIGKTFTDIDRLLSYENLSEKIKLDFFQSVAMLVVVSCTPF